MKRFILVLLMIFCTAEAAYAIKMVSIDAGKVNMRSGPGSNYAILWELGKGYPLKVVGNKGNWVKVEDFEGDRGWVYRKLLGRKAHLIVKKRRVNVRSGPGRNYRVVGKANYGVVFRTLSRKNGWVKIRHENGLTGWIKRNLLWGW